jgi:hypothetical protein
MSTPTYHYQISDEPGIPKFARVLIAILAVGVLVFVVLIGLRSPSTSAQASAIESAPVIQEFIPGQVQGFVIGVNNAMLYMPADAITIAGKITIVPREPNMYPMAGENWVRLLVVDVQFTDTTGKTFRQMALFRPAEICFKITRERWEDYASHPDDYQVQYYAEGNNPPAWVTLPMITHPDQNQLCGVTDHLSLFALATRPETLIPLTGGPTPTPVTFWGLFGLDSLFGDDSVDPPPAWTPVPTEPPTQPPPTEPPTQPPTEPPTQPPTEPPTQPPTDPPTEPPTEPPTQPPTDPPTEPPTQPPTDPPTEPPTEPPTQPPTDPPPTDPPPDPTDPPTEPPTGP